MTIELKCTEGIILRTTRFRDHDQILTLFTLDQGILKLFYKGVKKKRQARGLYMPLTHVEIIYKEKTSEIFACENILLLQSYLSLREQLCRLEASCDFLQALQLSQCIGKAAPQLYHLLIYYLGKLPSVLDPWVLATSFRLKILKHEGLLAFIPLSKTGRFNEEELKLVEHLALCRSYNQLAQQILPLGFKLKVKSLFEDTIYA